MTRTLKVNPTVSIVLPVYNGEKYLQQAIRSITGQKFKDFELIVVNDNSTDNSLKIIKEFAKKDKRIKIVNNIVNKKLPGSLNEGFKIAKGKWFTWTSDDNILDPSFLEIMLRVIKNKAVDIVYSDYRAIDEAGRIVEVCKMVKPEDFP